MKKLDLRDNTNQNGEDKAKDDDQENNLEENINKEYDDLSKKWKFIRNHLKDLIIGEPSQGARTRSTFKDIHDHLAFVSQIEPKCIEEAKNDVN